MPNLYLCTEDQIRVAMCYICRLEVQWEACGNDWLSGSDCVGLSASSMNTCQAVCNSESDAQTNRAFLSRNLTVQVEG